MSIWLVIFVTLCYVGVAIDQGIKGNIATCIMFVGYAIANCGIMGALS